MWRANLACVRRALLVILPVAIVGVVGAIVAIGARETAVNVMSRAARCGSMPST